MQSEHRSDEWLMRAVARGGREHVATLVRRYANPLLTFIQRMVGDRHRAEELFQEVFLAVWTSRETYKHPRPFRPWLFGIALNKCRAAFRKPMPWPMVMDDESPDPPVAGGPSPPEAVMACETAGLVAAGVARLPPGQRMVLVLRIWNGLSYGEIAETMDVTPATVRSHMFHALAAMRKYLEPRMREM